MQQNDNEPELPHISDYLYSDIFILLNFGYTVYNFLPISNLHSWWNELQWRSWNKKIDHYVYWKAHTFVRSVEWKFAILQVSICQTGEVRRVNLQEGTEHGNLDRIWSLYTEYGPFTQNMVSLHRTWSPDTHDSLGTWSIETEYDPFESDAVF